MGISLETGYIPFQGVAGLREDPPSGGRHADRDAAGLSTDGTARSRAGRSPLNIGGRWPCRSASWTSRTSARFSAVKIPTTFSVSDHGKTPAVAVLKPREGGLEHVARVCRRELAVHHVGHRGIRSVPTERGGQLIPGEHADQSTVFHDRKVLLETSQDVSDRFREWVIRPQ